MTHANPPTKLLNVHEVLSDAANGEPPAVEATCSQSFRLSRKVKHLADEICKNNGTTASEFYRKCAETLVAEYLP